MKVALLIDGGYARAIVRERRLTYNPDLIERMAQAATRADEEVFRILYYDCLPYNGIQRLPVSGNEQRFDRSGEWLHSLARRDLFAIRLGILKFRGFIPKNIPIGSRELTDDDFKPDFEQKGVDMRIGLDIANYANNRVIERLIVITGDTDCVPAFKHARKSGLQVVLVELSGSRLAPELREHADFVRAVPLA